MTDGSTLAYDYLILATGTDSNYFGHAEWRTHAPSLNVAAPSL
jgi:NADH dehydrogenase